MWEVFRCWLTRGLRELLSVAPAVIRSIWLGGPAKNRGTGLQSLRAPKFARIPQAPQKLRLGHFDRPAQIRRHLQLQHCGRTGAHREST
jgi:hypothetical protein